jgi:site-specific recombinase XerD
VAKGVDIETVRDLLGHHSITVTQRYTHSSDDRKKTAVELLSGEKPVTQLVTQEEESKLIH